MKSFQIAAIIALLMIPAAQATESDPALVRAAEAAIELPGALTQGPVTTSCDSETPSAPRVQIAGTESSGGGGGVGFLCGEEVFLADTYDLAKAGKLDLRRGGLIANDELYLIPADEEEILGLVTRSKILSEEESHEIDSTLKKLIFDPACPAEVTHDDNIQEVPNGCRKVQLATQRNGKVCINSELVDRMSGIEKGLLKIHEAYVYAYKRPNEFTTRLRQRVSEIADTNKFGVFAAPRIMPMLSSFDRPRRSLAAEQLMLQSLLQEFELLQRITRNPQPTLPGMER